MQLDTRKYLPKHTNGKTDYRYSIRKEFCGYEGLRWVVRFCDSWIDQTETVEQARDIAHKHSAERLAKL